jgi:hypothetical protein
MSCTSSRAELSERSTGVHGRPALPAPVVTQLVTEPECQTLKRNLELLPRRQWERGASPAPAASRAAAVDRWLTTFDGVLCPVCPTLPRRLSDRSDGHSLRQSPSIPHRAVADG